MGLEQKINYQLNKYPKIKKVIKRVYQRTMYMISPKIKSEGDIICVSPKDDFEYFFGYYDKSPWDITNRYMICMKAKDTWSDVSPREEAEILIIDTKQNNKVYNIATTTSWNVQQGCMAQWLGPDYSNKIIYNDFRNGKYCSIIITLKIDENNVSVINEKELLAPVYSVASDGSFALTLDFSRLYNLRPGYGYYNVPEETKDIAIPKSTCIWKLDILNNKLYPLLNYSDFSNFEPRDCMINATHKVNHIMISPNNDKFMVLHRWFDGQRKYTRLVTCNIDGTNMYNLSDDDMVSHCFWKDNNTILSFLNKNSSGPGYYILKDRTKDYIHIWKNLSNDGHPSYSPVDFDLAVTDSYPDRARIANIRICKDNENTNEDSNIIAKVFAPFKYDNDTRCDLHPRWRRDGKYICFDSIFEGRRRLYIVEVKNHG